MSNFVVKSWANEQKGVITLDKISVGMVFHRKGKWDSYNCILTQIGSSEVSLILLCNNSNRCVDGVQVENIYDISSSEFELITGHLTLSEYEYMGTYEEYVDKIRKGEL